MYFFNTHAQHSASEWKNTAALTEPCPAVGSEACYSFRREASSDISCHISTHQRVCACMCACVCVHVNAYIPTNKYIFICTCINIYVQIKVEV
uniref:Uncharacterized protein n=1 Tax=Anguilla anguilla TaxID=7936 RepID=A0A0E9WV39_ANGAN